MIRPIIGGIDNVEPVMWSARKAPGTDSTSATRMVTGWRKSFRSRTSTA
jgi:hypothetical protein